VASIYPDVETSPRIRSLITASAVCLVRGEGSDNGSDALGRRTPLTRPNGINTGYTYDSLSRLLSVLHQAGGVTVDGAGYTLDNAGNRTGKTNLLTQASDVVWLWRR
jgi:YD repeat-containing protein